MVGLKWGIDEQNGYKSEDPSETGWEVAVEVVVKYVEDPQVAKGSQLILKELDGLETVILFLIP